MHLLFIFRHEHLSPEITIEETFLTYLITKNLIS